MANNKDYSKISLYFPATEESIETFRCIEAFKHKKTQFITLLISNYMKKCHINSYKDLTDAKIKLILNDLTLHGSMTDSTSNELLTILIQKMSQSTSDNNIVKETSRELCEQGKTIPETKRTYEEDEPTEIDTDSEISNVNKQDTLDALSMFY